MIPIKPITMQDVRLVAGEGKLPARAVLDAVNAILRQRGIVGDAGKEIERLRAALREIQACYAGDEKVMDINIMRPLIIAQQALAGDEQITPPHPNCPNPATCRCGPTDTRKQGI